MGSTDRHAWLSTPPRGPRYLVEWIGDAASLAGLTELDVGRRAEEHAHRLIAAHPARATDIVRAAARMVADERLWAALLPPSPTLDDLLSARRTMRAAERRGADELFRAQVLEALPDPTTLPTTAAIADTVGMLQDAAASDPVAADIGRSWATRVVEHLPEPETAGALTWWLGELDRLTPLLRDWESRARQQVERFVPALLRAREREQPMWEEVSRAWEALGRPTEALAAEIERASRPKTKTETKNGTKRGKRARRKRRR